MKLNLKRILFLFMCVSMLASCSLLGNEKTPTETPESTEKNEPTEEQKPTTDNLSFEITIISELGENKITINEGEKFNLKDINNIPSKEGYRFAGWYLDADYKTECTLEEISYANNITTLYAKMTEENIDVVLTLIVGENTTTKTMIKRQEFTLKSVQPTIDGIKIENWYYDETLTKKVENKISLTEDTTLYAKYTVLKIFNINILCNDETLKVQKYENEKIKITDYYVEKENYILDGWYYDEELTVKANNELIITADTTLYIYSYEKKYTDVIFIKCFTNFEETTTKQLCINSWFNVASLDSNVEHYNFIGYFLDENFEKPITSKLRVSEDLKIYLKYEELEKVNVKLIYPFEEKVITTIHIDDIFSDKKLTNLPTLENLKVENYYYDSSYLKVVDNFEYKVDSILTDNEILIYVKCLCDLTINVNNELEIVKTFDYGEKLNFEDINVLVGEDYRLKTLDIPVDETLNLTEHKLVNALGVSYLNFGIYDSFDYIFNGNEVTITKYTGNNPMVKIPSYIENQKVTKINNYAFDVNTVQVIIPSTITNIESYAFTNCPKLIEIYNLSQVKINTKLAKHIYTDLDEVSKLSTYNNEFILYKNNDINYLVSYLGIKTKLTLPSLTNDFNYELYDYAFYGNDTINTLIIQEGIKKISNYAFAKCSNLFRVVLPSSLEDLGLGSFESDFCLLEIYNNSKFNIKVGDDSNQGLGLYALAVYSNGEKFNNNLFYYEYNKNNYNYEAVIYILDNKMYFLGLDKACSENTIVYLPDNINDLNYSLYHHVFYDDVDLQSINIPLFLDEIPNSAFENCFNLKEVSFVDTENSNLNEIKDFAFYNCHKISKFVSPNTVEKIGRYSFGNCTSLFNISLNDGLNEIGDGAFSGLTKLLEFEIPNSVIVIGEKMLYNSKNIATLSIPFVGKSRDEVVYNYFGWIFGGISSNEEINIGIPTTLKKLTIKDDEILAQQAFFNCQRITEITFVNTKSVSVATFAYCKNLTTLSFSKNILFETCEEDSFYETNIKLFKTDYAKKILNNEYLKDFIIYDENGIPTNIYTYSEPEFVLELERTLFYDNESYSDTFAKDNIKTLTATLNNEVEKIIINLLENNLFKVKFESDVKNEKNFLKSGSYYIKVTIYYNGTSIKFSEEITVEHVEEPEEETETSENETVSENLN